MLVIRTAQMEQMGQQQERDFETRVMGYARQNFPEKTANTPDPDLRQTVRRRITVGREYGLQSRGDLCLFVGLSFALHPDFDQRPEFRWAKRVLSGPGDPSARIACVVAMAQEWLAAPPPGPAR
jgi:hypothetical protein